MSKKRVLSFFLVLCMLVSMLPGTVFAEESVTEEPAYEKPMYDDPTYEEPAYEEFANEEFSYEEPAYEESANEEPLYEQSAYEEPANEEPADEEPPYEEPAYEEPAYEESANEEPANEEPANEEPANEEPANEEPTNEEPANEEPANEEPAYEEPAYEEPAYEEPAYEEPANEEPANEEPAYEEPANEEPAYEEPANEEPANEEPANEEPANEEPANEEEIIADSVAGQTASLEAVLSGEPSILGQPDDVNAEVGDYVSFNVYTDESVYYEWEYRESSSSAWKAYTGDGCTDYEIGFQAEYAMNGWQFRCKLSNDVGSVYSKAATLNVYVNPPEIYSFSGDVTVTEGETAWFSVEASGYDLSYQWQVRKNTSSNWINSGAEGNKTAELQIKATLSLNGYQYRCVVSNPGGSAYSDEATLYVDELNLITDQPEDQEVYQGSKVQFWVGTYWYYAPLAFQWQVRKDADSNWSNSGLSSATSSNLEFTPSYSLNGYQYRCAVTYNGVTKYSEPATLTVYLNSPKIYGELHDAYAGEGTSISLHVDDIYGDLLSYQWQVRKNSDSDWVNSGVASAKTDTLTLTPGASLNGYQYRLAVTNDAGTAYSNAATLHVIAKPKITVQPASVTVGNDVKTDFSVGVEGYDLYEFSYQWQVRKNSSASWSNSGAAGNQSNTVTITASSVLNGYQYRCVVTKRETDYWDYDITTTAVSSAATLTVVNLPDPVFTRQPNDEWVYEGDKTSFSVGVTDSSLSYQWQVRNNSTGWVNSGIASAKTATLSFTAGTNHSGNEYRCAILSGTTVVGYSRAVSLYVNEMQKPYPNSYNEEHQDYSIYAGDGESQSIHSSFSGGGISSYQWQVRKDSASNWGNSSLASAKSDTLTITASMAMEGYQYRCIAKNAKGSGMCEAITLHVVPKPKITAQPASVTVGEGVAVAFTVGVDREDTGEWTDYYFSYQWQVRKNSSANWSNSGASGNQSDTLSLTPSLALNGYQYRCIVKKTVENWYDDVRVTTTSTSSAATLTVLPKATFTRQPESQDVYEGEKVSFSVSVTDSSLSYQWQVRNESTDWEWINSGIANAKTANLSFTANMSHNENQYRCVIKSGSTVVGYSNTAYLDVYEVDSPEVDDDDPYSVFAGEGETVSIQGRYDFNGEGLSYQWQVRKDSSSNWGNSSLPSAKSDTLTFTASMAMEGYQYRCIAKNIKGTATGGIKTLHVFPKPKITSQPKSVSTTEGMTTQFSVEVEGVAIAGYDEEDDWWNEDDVSFSYQWQVRKNSSASWSNSGITSARTDTLSVTPSLSLNGYQYRCVVTRTEEVYDDYYGWESITTTTTSSAATLTVFQKPEITAQPKSVTVNEGTATSFSVTASGTGLSYQWQVRKNSSSNWANSGATGNKTNTLNLTASASLAGYQYRCQVKTSEGGTAYSSAATLNIVLKPRIVTQPANRTANAQETAWFSVEATGTSLTYQWQVRKNTSASWSNSGAAGSKTDTLSVTAATTLNGYQYRCVIKNAAGTVASSAATLTVKNVKASGWVEQNVKWTLDGGKLSVFLADGYTGTAFNDWSAYREYIYTAAFGEGLYGAGGCYNCTNLKSVSLPSTLKRINGGAFNGCSSLTSIKMPASLESIANYAFANCYELTSLSIPSTVNSLGENAFQNCRNLVSVNIPTGVTAIQNNLFSGCQALSAITIPSSVTTIGGWAFSGCVSLASISIPSSVKEIGQSAFSNCRSLRSISIPLGVTRVADNTFYCCYTLSSVTLPTSITAIGNYAFYNTSLTSVKIPTHTVSIGDSAFNYCYSLQTISLPKSLTSIGNYATGGCSNLRTVRYQGTSADFSKISIGSGNEYLLQANRLYNTY